MAVMLESSKGDLVVDLFTEECPITSKNFLKLCKYVAATQDHLYMGTDLPAKVLIFLRRLKYYNNVLFHNVQSNFIVQTGDPTGTGKGGDSVYG